MKPKLLLSLVAGSLLWPATMSAHQEEADSLRVQQLEEVTVYGTRMATQLKKIPSKVELIQTPEIARASADNLGDLLKAQSSVDIIQYPGFLSTIGIRGFSSNGKYVNILVDGIPAGTTNISTLGLSDLHQIEVLKGPFSAIYGTGAMGGVVNMVTRKSKDELSGKATLAGGSYGSLRGSLGLGGRIVGGLSFDLGVNYTEQLRDYKAGRNNFFNLSPLEEAILDSSTRGATKRGSAYDALMGRLRLGYDFSAEWSLNLYQSLFTTKGLGIGGSNWNTADLTSKDLNRYSVSMELLGRAGRHALQLRPYYNVERADNYNTYGDPSAIATYRSTTKTLGFLLQDNISILGHQLVLGLDGKRLDTEAKRYDGTSGNAIKPYNPAYSTTSLGAFAQANMGFLEDRLFVSAGARLDYMLFELEANKLLGNAGKTEKYTTISPNLGVKYELVRGLLLHASAGAGFLAPDAYQKAGEYQGAYGKTRGNPDLNPERSITIDFGLGYSNKELGLQADVSYFVTRHKDLIVSTPADSEGFRSYANADKSRMSGVEVLLSYDFGSLADYAFSLRAFANATFIIKSEMLLKGAWSDIYYVRKQNITYGLEYKSAGGLELALRGRFAGRRIEQNWNTGAGIRPTLPALLSAEYPDLAAKGLLPYPRTMTLDLSAHYTILRDIRLGAHLNNMLDEHYAEKDGYNMIGRHFLLTLGVSF